jgi:hypothetical protein
MAQGGFHPLELQRAQLINTGGFNGVQWLQAGLLVHIFSVRDFELFKAGRYIIQLFDRNQSFCITLQK